MHRLVDVEGWKGHIRTKGNGFDLTYKLKINIDCKTFWRFGVFKMAG